MSFLNWCRQRHELIQKLVAHLASFASFIGLLVAFLPSPQKWEWWVTVLVVSAVLAFVIVVVLEFSNRPRRHIFTLGDAKRIKRYMHNWIDQGGRVAIWSRDLSWADNPDTIQVLTKKAQRNELILCLPELTTLAQSLADAGAEVCAYGIANLESPASRFTITFFGRDGAQVAVGRAVSNNHIIDEFESGDHPAFYLAEDLVALARALHRKKRR